MKTLKQILVECEKFLIESEHPMIDVDGIMKHRNNSLGQPIHPTDEGIRNFHRWFGSSKMVDEHGRPKVFYHGTRKDFERFDTNDGLGGSIFISPDAKYSANFADAKGGQIMPVYVKATNPHKKVVLAYDEEKHIKKAKKNGYDAVKIKDSFSNWEPENIAIFSGSQLKSAIGNSGAFSSHPHITEEKQ